MKPPCIENGIPCPNRHRACQDNCPKMAKIRERNKIIRAARDQEYEYWSYAIPLIIKNRQK